MIGRNGDRPRIAQVGAGVVGTAAGKGLLARGVDVVFVDIDPRARARLRTDGCMAVAPEELDGSRVDFFLVSVPTYDHGDPAETGALESAIRNIAGILRDRDDYSVVVVRSTVLPGTTEELVIPLLEEVSGRRVGRDFGVCVNPEYLREASAAEDFLRPPLVLIGEHDERSGRALAALYGWVDCPVVRTGLREAELEKIVHNVFNAVKISFFNEIRGICSAVGVDAGRVFPMVCLSAEAMWNPAYGTRDLGPFGGKCLPKDTSALLRFAEMRAGPTPMLRAALDVNEDLGADRRSAARRRLGVVS